MKELGWRSNRMKKFVLIGAAGYVAPKHMAAIKAVGGNLIACLDPHDSVGILDSYFPGCKYFSEFERFDRFCSGQDIDYTVVCSPNYLHDAHCRFGLRIGSDVICEKPLVLNERNLDGLLECESKYKHKIWNIMQLRYNKPLIDYSISVEHGILMKLPDIPIILKYYAPRGSWYDYSWKADVEKSGGLITNIGVHLVDILVQLFQPGYRYDVLDFSIMECKSHGDRTLSFELRLGRKVIFIVLSTDPTHKASRKLFIDNKVFDLSKGFGSNHNTCYEYIMHGHGVGIESVRPAIRICETIRNQLGRG
jgi:UDP-N-acetyl-2-amino-2-deoxyglucuronate dehydrogenase